jgi:hypothetical protein
MYSKALAPFFNDLDQNRENQQKLRIMSDQEGFRRQQMALAEQRRQEILQRELRDKQLEAVLKVLQTTGQVDDTGAQALAGTPYSGLLGPGNSLKKSPEQLAQEAFQKEDRDLKLQRGQQQVQQGQRQLELPQVLQQIFQNNPDADYRKIGPQLVGAGAVKPDVLLRLGQGDRQFGAREGRMASQFNTRQNAVTQKPPSTAQQRLDDQNKYADVVIASMMPDESDLADSSSGDLDGYIEDVHAAQRTSAKLPTQIYARFIERLEALRQGQ